MAVCSWADHFTQGAVADNSPDSFGVTPEQYDLDALAKRTARIRDEVRVPVNGRPLVDLGGGLGLPCLIVGL